MADFEDELLRDAFAGLTLDAGPFVRPAGSAAARATVRHRRRVRAVAVSIVVALALAIPAVAWAGLTGDPQDRVPRPGGSGPSPTGTTAPPTTPPTGTPPPTATSAPATPDGRISREQLNRSTIDVPEWEMSAGCRHGKVRFPSSSLKIVDSAQANLDGDPGRETAALLGCSTGGPERGMLLALDRDASGRIVTKGVIVQSVQGMAGVLSVEGAGDGVTVEVADMVPCCDTPADVQQTQLRTYAWSGTGYQQIGGPVTFPPNPHVTDLSVTAAPLELTGGEGTLVLTIRNKGDFDAPSIGVKVIIDGLTIASPRPAACDATTCVGRLAAGETTTVRLAVKRDAAPLGDGTVHVYSKPPGTGAVSYPDLNTGDNEVTVNPTGE